MDLYYEIYNKGYHIYDRNNSLFHIHQYEPYIPDHSKSYEENAQLQIADFLRMEQVSINVEKVLNNEITINEVSEEYKEEVQYIINHQKGVSEQDIIDEIVEAVSADE